MVHKRLKPSTRTFAGARHVAEGMCWPLTSVFQSFWGTNPVSFRATAVWVWIWGRQGMASETSAPAKFPHFSPRVSVSGCWENKMEGQEVGAWNLSRCRAGAERALITRRKSLFCLEKVHLKCSGIMGVAARGRPSSHPDFCEVSILSRVFSLTLHPCCLPSCSEKITAKRVAATLPAVSPWRCWLDVIQRALPEEIYPH